MSSGQYSNGTWFGVAGSLTRDAGTEWALLRSNHQAAGAVISYTPGHFYGRELHLLPPENRLSFILPDTAVYIIRKALENE